MNTESRKVTSPEECPGEPPEKDDMHRAALVAGIILPDEKDSMTVTETDTNIPPQAPPESSDSDETLVPLPDPRSIPPQRTKRVHSSDVERNSEPNILDMVPPLPIQSQGTLSESRRKERI